MKEHFLFGWGSLDNGLTILTMDFSNKYEKNIKNRKILMDMFFYL
jgi:hypothetical protein